MVTVEAFGAVFEIPDDMIQGYYEEFKDLKNPSEKLNVIYLRDITGAVLSALSKEPHRMKQDVYVEDFIRAHAMRQALSRHKMLFDA